MTADTNAMPRRKGLGATNALLLVVTLILLIVGFPGVLFGVFLALTQGPDGIGGDVAFRFILGGLASVACALGGRAYLLKRDGWF